MLKRLRERLFGKECERIQVYMTCVHQYSSFVVKRSKPYEGLYMKKEFMICDKCSHTKESDASILLNEMFKKQ
jgi:hypothetical protein